MKAKLILLAVMATLVAAFTAATTAPAQAAPVPVIGGVTCTTPMGVDVPCTLQLVGFSGQGGTLSAVFQLTNTLTGQATRVLVPIGTIAQQQGTCTILDLQTEDIDLFLLGLHLHIDPIRITLTAQRGTLLGDLLCGLFFGNPTGGLLNQILRNGVVTAAPA
jgi:hypothetical protein